MREIKFRAWNEENQRMSQGESLLVMLRSEHDNGIAEGMIGMSQYGCDSEKEHYGHLIFLLYTDLKDKNGKEIYEGDIIKHFMPNTQWENEEIIYDNEYSMFRFADSLWPYTSLGEWLKEIWTQRSFEVIGNVYENPELSKEDNGARAPECTINQ